LIHPFFLQDKAIALSRIQPACQLPKKKSKKSQGHPLGDHQFIVFFFAPTPWSHEPTKPKYGYPE